MNIDAIVNIGQHWGLPTLASLGFFYIMIRYVVPALAKVTLDQIKTISDSNEKNIKVITDSNKENIKQLIDSNEKARGEAKENFKQLAEQTEKLLNKITDHNLQIHGLYANKIDSVMGKMDGIVTELREFKDEISQRIEEVTINFQKI